MFRLYIYYQKFSLQNEITDATRYAIENADST